jgi:peptidoglycan/xylan/chitin deacetylase (PgdA/CDA1 family)
VPKRWHPDLKGLMKSYLIVAALCLSCAIPALASDQKLIALTFDDGPRPYVLYGTHLPGKPPTPGLLDLLDKNGIKATFFVMGWRLTPKTWGERHETNIGVTCIDAAKDEIKRGHEIENHTYGHEELRGFEKRHGAAGALADIDHCTQVIKAATGEQARFIRPPEWILPPDLRLQIEKRGYEVMTISPQNPIAVRDVNSLDYLCAGKATQCPKPSLADSVLKQIAAREKQGVTTHILAFHELSTTVTTLQTLIPELKARGYKFVRLDEYMRAVGGNRGVAVAR